MYRIYKLSFLSCILLSAACSKESDKGTTPTETTVVTAPTQIPVPLPSLSEENPTDNTESSTAEVINKNDISNIDLKNVWIQKESIREKNNSLSFSSTNPVTPENENEIKKEAAIRAANKDFNKYNLVLLYMKDVNGKYCYLSKNTETKAEKFSDNFKVKKELSFGTISDFSENGGLGEFKIHYPGISQAIEYKFIIPKKSKNKMYVFINEGNSNEVNKNFDIMSFLATGLEENSYDEKDYKELLLRLREHYDLYEKIEKNNLYKSHKESLNDIFEKCKFYE